MKKILVTGGNGMLAYDFQKTQSERFEIIAVDRNACDITSFESILQCLSLYEPDFVLNCAAYTAVDDAEDIGMKMNYDINALGVYFLAQATSAFGIPLIHISTDYVFDGTKQDGYSVGDTPNPINQYGMAKYLGERLAQRENPQTMIVRTSWLYGGEVYDAKNPEKSGVYKNFVNTMLKLAETRDTVRVVDDQHGRPTNAQDLSEFIGEYIQSTPQNFGGVFHFSSPHSELSLTWVDFAREIFAKYGKNTTVVPCKTSEYPTKAKRPEWSVLRGDSELITEE